jgi:hypothetical protein
LRSLACGLVLLVATLAQPPAGAAGITIENTDRNNAIEILDALPEESGARILYATQPVLGQAHQAERCAVNFYLLKLAPGLADAKPQLLTRDYCFHFGMTGRLLENGDVLILAGANVEIWRPGAGRVGGWQIGSLGPAGRSGGGPDAPEGMRTAVARNGDAVLAMPYLRKRNDFSTPSGVVVRVSREGKTLWTRELDETGVLLSVIDAWAAKDGGAWLHVNARAMEGSRLPGVDAPPGAQVVGQNRLYRLGAKGEVAAAVVLATDQMQDFSAPPPAMPDPGTDPEAFQAALQAALAQSEELTQGKFYGYGDIVGHARSDGGLDLLAGRRADEAELIRIGPAGEVLMRTSLSEAMTAEGLRDWIDFSVDDREILLYGTLGTRQHRLSQGYLSRIDLDSGEAVTRLVPLSELGLEEAQQAGDEEVQYLENNPAQRGRLLTSLSGRPLTVSLVYRSRRQAIQLDEGTDQLLVYTEARDERQAQARKEAGKAQRKADREARDAAMNAEMAAAIGVSEEEYAAMSSKERKEAMIRHGDMDAMMAAAMKQAELAQQMAATQGAGGQAATAGMTPEMAAAIAQAQQSMAAAGLAVPGTAPNASAADTTPASGAAPGPSGGPIEGDPLPVDVHLRGIVEFEHPDGSATTLVIKNRRSGAELLRKEYEDGSIYEYLDFGRYQTPLEEIAVVIGAADGSPLKELTPVIAE